VALIGVAVAVVNASSDIVELQRADLPFANWEPILWEVTSATVIVAMAPLIGRAIRAWPPRSDRLLRFVAIHAALTLPFSLTHIAAIYVLRTLTYWLANAHYGFFDDGVLLVGFYEWRKDVLTYASIAALYWLHDYISARRRLSVAAETDQRIELRDGGAAVFLQPQDILFVEAAGNYVEFHTAARTHLVRSTLAHWEAQLTARGFLRVHRSRLVNRARIAAIRPTASGDVEITLDDGRTLAGSRRYRASLEAPALMSKGA
jgi:hypothetical protein